MSMCQFYISVALKLLDIFITIFLVHVETGSRFPCAHSTHLNVFFHNLVSLQRRVFQE